MLALLWSHTEEEKQLTGALRLVSRFSAWTVTVENASSNSHCIRGDEAPQPLKNYRGIPVPARSGKNRAERLPPAAHQCRRRPAGLVRVSTQTQPESKLYRFLPLAIGCVVHESGSGLTDRSGSPSTRSPLYRCHDISAGQCAMACPLVSRHSKSIPGVFEKSAGVYPKMHLFWSIVQGEVDALWTLEIKKSVCVGLYVFASVGSL